MERWVNSLWSSGTIWWHKTGSTLAQVMACWLTAPSPYLNQCWLVISKVHWLYSSHQSLKLSLKVLKSHELTHWPFWEVTVILPNSFNNNWFISWVLLNEMASKWMVQGPSNVNIGWDNGLVPSGNKPLPQPMLTQIYVIIIMMLSLGHSELTHWPLGDLDAILKLQFSILFYLLISSHRLRIRPWDEWQGTSLMISQHWFR